MKSNHFSAEQILAVCDAGWDGNALNACTIDHIGRGPTLS